MAKRKVTSTQVAEAAGVSQATVSMVLNKKYNVSFSKEVIKKVEEEAQRLGYELPRKRKQRESKRDGKREKLIVVFCPNLTNPYYVMLLQGIENQAKERGYTTLVCNTQRDLKLEERYLKMIEILKPQGVIYTCNPSKCFMELIEVMAEEVPITVINNQNEKLSVDAVELDNTKLGRLMANHLIELGHTCVAYIAPPLTTRQKQRSKRVEGFIKQYEASGLKPKLHIMAANEERDLRSSNIDSEYRIGYELTKELLESKDDVTAIVGLNDMIAFGILDALSEAKYKVPQDVSVMGCDNTLFGRVQKIALTTIEHFVLYKGRDACDIILKKIESKRYNYDEIEPISTYHVEYEPKLIVRGTTGPAKIRK